MRPVLLAAAAAAATAAVPALAPPAAHAQPVSDHGDSADGVDYDIANRSWKGLYTLEAIARGMGLQVLSVSAVDWDDLERDDILFLLYPTRRIEPAHLDSFVQNGGRVLLADDFGGTDDALASLGILRGAASGVVADEFWDDQPFTPIARPLVASHPLADQVPSLVTNYPSVWRTTEGLRPVLGFHSGAVVVAALEQGEGRLVALSDPSVLINRMLEFDGNLAFAINLLRWLSRPGETRRLVILSGDMTLFGEPSRQLGGESLHSVSGLLASFNHWLWERSLYVLSPERMRVIAVLTALLVSLIALVALPRAPKTALDGSWTRASGPAEEATSEDLVALLDRGGRRVNFALPAAILRDTVNRRLGILLGQPDPLYAVPERALIAAVRERAGPEAAEAVHDLYPLLAGLPTRAQAASPWQAPLTPERDFARMSAASERLYRSLPLRGERET